jgi:NADP-dependent 3-hydroxy acid dehydrogenase YdfG
MNELEKEVFIELQEVEKASEILEVVEKLNGERRSVEGEVIVNAAGYMLGKGLYEKSRENKYE